MLHFFGIFFLIILVILFIGLSLIGNLFYALFGGKRRYSPGTSQNGAKAYRQDNRSGNTTSADDRTTAHSTPSKHKKLFDADDGEYVDFEEIKE